MQPQQILFYIPAIEIKPPKGQKCSNCKNCYKHQYGKMLYCSLKKQKNTAYGDKKVKAKDWCSLYKSKD